MSSTQFTIIQMALYTLQASSYRCQCEKDLCSKWMISFVCQEVYPAEKRIVSFTVFLPNMYSHGIFVSVCVLIHLKVLSRSDTFYLTQAKPFQIIAFEWRPPNGRKKSIRKIDTQIFWWSYAIPIAITNKINYMSMHFSHFTHTH